METARGLDGARTTPFSGAETRPRPVVNVSVDPAATATLQTAVQLVHDNMTAFIRSRVIALLQNLVMDRRLAV